MRFFLILKENFLGRIKILIISRFTVALPMYFDVVCFPSAKNGATKIVAIFISNLKRVISCLQRFHKKFT
jgi:hypothetical protein